MKKVKPGTQKAAARATDGKPTPSKIDHVVVLMLENRSFDHIFGFHPKVNGLKGSEFNLLDPSRPKSASNPSFSVSDAAPYAVLAGQGPSHSIDATNYQLTNDPNGPHQGLVATNDGFVRNYRDALLHDNVPNPANNVVNVVMESFAPSALPSINTLADAFCLCDNWYAEVPGPTQPNRFYVHAATSAGFGFNNWQRVMTVTTIYNSLQRAGRTWTTYSFDSNEVREFSQINTQNQNFKQFQESFQADIQSNALANYSFVIPRFLNSTNLTHSTDGMANSQHAPQDARYGDNLVADVYDALRSNPQLWSKCCLIVTYDEHGGFYDHVAPPQNVPNPDGKNSPQPGDPAWAPLFAFARLGLRVPAVIASPWVPAGKIDSTQYQHTSVLATLKTIFGLKNFLSKRDQSANNFAHLFDRLSQPRTDTPVTLPRAPLPKISVPVTDPGHPANHPLDQDQQDLLFKVFHLTKSSQPRNLTAASLPRTQGAAHDFIQQSYRKHFGPPAKPGVKPTARRRP